MTTVIETEEQITERILQKYQNLIEKCETNEALVKPLMEYLYAKMGCQCKEVILVDSIKAMDTLYEYIETSFGKKTDEEIIAYCKEWAANPPHWSKYTNKSYCHGDGAGTISDFKTAINIEVELELGNNVPVEYLKYRDLLHACLFSIDMFDQITICCRMPKYMKMKNNQLHCVDGPAIFFRDNTVYYFINGTDMDPAVFKQNKLTE